MMACSYSRVFILLIVIGVAVGQERYSESGDSLDQSIRKDLENLREIYKDLLSHKLASLEVPIAVQAEHLMTRKSQRSPSLRLRFGRSGPRIPVADLPRPIDSLSAFDDDN